MDSKPLYDEETTIYIPAAQANEQYQDLIAKHKNLGARLHHDTRRLALALAQRIRKDGAAPTDWELALMEDAGLTQAELPKRPNLLVKELRLPAGESWCK